MGLAIKDELVSQGKALDELTEDVDSTSSKMKQVWYRHRGIAMCDGRSHRSIDRSSNASKETHAHARSSRRPSYTYHMAIYSLSQAQHVMTKLLKSKDGCKLKP